MEFELHALKGVSGASQSPELFGRVTEKVLPCMFFASPTRLFNKIYMSCAGAFLDSRATDNAVSLRHTVVE